MEPLEKIAEPTPPRLPNGNVLSTMPAGWSESLWKNNISNAEFLS
jgi:hypothetical protein